MKCRCGRTAAELDDAGVCYLIKENSLWSLICFACYTCSVCEKLDWQIDDSYSNTHLHILNIIPPICDKCYECFGCGGHCTFWHCNHNGKYFCEYDCMEKSISRAGFYLLMMVIKRKCFMLCSGMRKMLFDSIDHMPLNRCSICFGKNYRDCAICADCGQTNCWCMEQLRSINSNRGFGFAYLDFNNTRVPYDKLKKSGTVTYCYNCEQRLPKQLCSTSERLKFEYPSIWNSLYPCFNSVKKRANQCVKSAIHIKNDQPPIPKKVMKKHPKSHGYVPKKHMQNLPRGSKFSKRCR
jgi:hypothetical protein